MDVPAPIKDLQDEVASMIPRIIGDCTDVTVRYARIGAGQVPHHLFWAKVDPHGLMTRDKKLWEKFQSDMKVPVITINFSRGTKSQWDPDGDKWDFVDEEMGKIISKYTQMFLNRGKGYEPWRGLDPRLILFKFKPYDRTIGPTCARARIPPECSEAYRMFLGIDTVQALTYKTMLYLDKPHDQNRAHWEREWVDWNGELAEREAYEAELAESRHRHGQIRDEIRSLKRYFRR
ncbi:hypothetical protein F4805DRAFT_1505 [Annulohypoxylon moriforme]|nr:hypothetical protein F4805DRAFT_1505 [Annulohypoxylon moriforme]